MHQAHRSEERVSMHLPVNLQGGATGITRDLSASGIYFETDIEPIQASPLAFTVEFQSGDSGMTLRCQGQVLRVERLGARIGVAARILESRLEPGRAKPAPTRLVISDGFADSF
jgi:hypothetical protein